MLGNVNDALPAVNCYDQWITEDVIDYTIYSDSNDMEGFSFTGHAGTVFDAKANSIDGVKQKLGGIIIGFSVTFGEW